MYIVKVIATLFVLCCVQQTSFAASIKSKLPPEIQELLRDVDILAIELESDIDTIALLQKHDMSIAKSNSKMTLKRLQGVVKASKGTLCGQVASLQLSTIKEKADDLKLCNEKNLKKCKSELHSYLKGVSHEAVSISTYCSFISFTTEDYEICVVGAVEGLRNKVETIDANIRENLLVIQNKSRECVEEVTTELELSTIELEHNLDVCLNPPTTPEPTEAPSSEEPSNEASNSNEEPNTSEASNSNEEPNTSEAPNSGEAPNSSEAPNSGEGSNEQSSEPSGNTGSNEQTSEEPSTGNSNEEPAQSNEIGNSGETGNENGNASAEQPSNENGNASNGNDEGNASNGNDEEGNASNGNGEEGNASNGNDGEGNASNGNDEGNASNGNDQEGSNSPAQSGEGGL